MVGPTPLAAELLVSRCPQHLLDFQTTAGLPAPDVPFAHGRAIDAVRTAMEIGARGFNVFVLGEPGSNRHGIIRAVLEAHARQCPPPGDWVYVNNFAEPNRPRAIRLPPGHGARLRADMQQFVTELGQAIAAGFDSEEYRGRIESLQNEYKEREEAALGELGDAAVEQGIAFIRTPQGFAFVPMKGEETLDPEAFAALPDDERERIGKKIAVLRERLHRLLQQFPRWRREMQGRIRDASHEALQLAVGHLIEDLKDRHRDLPSVQSFLDEVLRDVVEVGQELRDQAAKGAPTEGGLSPQRYEVNLLVHHDGDGCAPLVCEEHPTYPNLVGRVDHIATMGTLVTNFTLIRAGALHRANGGYLMLDAEKVLGQPYAWEGLKRALKSGEIVIESLAQVFGWAGALPLEPAPIPLTVKVALFGQRLHYYLLKQYDPEFAELFKVAADFEDSIARTDDSTRDYLRMLGLLAHEQGLRPLAAAAAGRLVEHSARLAGDGTRLSTHTRELADLLHEADHRAHGAGVAAIRQEDVEAVIAARIRRADRLRERVHEAVLSDTLLIATTGEQIAQVNGLAVIELADFSFGRPMRITATAHAGEGGVVDIERKAELGGAIHSKGVMILAAYLASRFADKAPLSLAASLVFEQSYGTVEGDSASLAELCALLSALAALPIRQSLAVTGSVNQHGRVQAIGGVNEKIEGFFDICRARGLTGEQGVIIPQSNVRHLMLRADVVEAARAGRFRVHAVTSADEAIELLTGVAAADAAGEGSVHRRIAARLAEFATHRKPDAAAKHSRGERPRVDKAGKEPDGRLN